MSTIIDDNYMKEEKIQIILKKIGLNDLEITCFKALLEKSPMKASEISKKFSIPKATVLVALYKMSDELGIIKRTKKKNSFLFLVDDVYDLINLLKRKEEALAVNRKEIEDSLPELRALQNFDIKKPKVYYYEGKEGIRQAYEQMLTEADHFLGYGSNEDDDKYLPELFPNYYDRRVQKKISVTAIIPALPFNIKETLKNETKHLRKTHLIPAEWNYPIQINTYKIPLLFVHMKKVLR